MSTTEIIKEKINKKISRRSFLKWSAAIGATSSISGLVLNSASKMAGATASDSQAPVTAKVADGGKIVDWRPSCCLVCHSWCAIAAGVDSSGHVRKIEGQGGQPKTYADGVTPIKTWPVAAATQTKIGDDNHVATEDGYLSYSCHNKGRICAKGNDGIEHLYDPDRVKTPLRRTGDRGNGTWETISWNEALKEIANQLREIAGLSTFYDLNDPDDDSLYAIGTPGKAFTKVPGSTIGPAGVARGSDLRHRHVTYVGRNENPTIGNFQKAYGVVNHIEHTSLCELSRHVARASLWGHHWGSPDHMTHSGTIELPSWASNGQPGFPNYVLGDDNDCDFYLEIGGNPAEAKIPHATLANHMGDRRRKNLQGYAAIAAEGGAPAIPARKGRIVVIDVRQSNSAAFADEYFQIVPGTDGALALGMMHYLMTEAPGSATLKAELDAGQLGPDRPANLQTTRKYYGIFVAEENADLVTNPQAVPVGKSLEAYLIDAGADGFASDIGAAGTDWATQVGPELATLTGIALADIEYLAKAVGGLDVGGGQKFANVTVDGYRGPSKHSNGVQNYRAIQALQLLAANRSACHFWGGRGAGAVAARGGYNAPGAYQTDKNWDPWMNGGGPPGPGSKAGATDKTPAAVPNSQRTWGSKQRIDDWDYDRDKPRWRGIYYRWVDQNTTAGIRFSLGLDPWKSGYEAYSGSAAGPYSTFDPAFTVESLLNHKNALSYARPNQEGDIAMLTYSTGTDGGGNKKYALRNFWSIDIAMGDGTRFADIVLPDATYLERWAERSGEGAECSYRETTFYRMPVYEAMTNVDFGGTTGIKSVPRHMYDIRQMKAIVYELARWIEPGNLASGDSEATWSGTLYDSFKWVTTTNGASPSADAGSIAANIAAGNAHYNDGEHAVLVEMKKQCFAGGGSGIADAAAAAGAADGLDYMRSQGYTWNANDTAAYWRSKYSGAYPGTGLTSLVGGKYAYNRKLKGSEDIGADGSTGNAHGIGKKLEFYSHKLDTLPDLVDNVVDQNPIVTPHTKADGYFHGTPKYLPVVQHNSSMVDNTFVEDSVTKNYDLMLTTYKINVHTQSRTQSLPRLMEIIGNNWAVMHPNDAAARSISNGDTVKVRSTLGEIELEAKVTDKAQEGCVHISHSTGHRDADAGKTNAAWGEYTVNTVSNRTTIAGTNWDLDLNNPNGGTDGASDVNVGLLDTYANALPPTAPGRGVHPNNVITQHKTLKAGAAYDGSTGELSTDPIGGSQCWFDTMINVEKV